MPRRSRSRSRSPVRNSRDRPRDSYREDRPPRSPRDYGRDDRYRDRGRGGYDRGERRGGRGGGRERYGRDDEPPQRRPQEWGVRDRHADEGRGGHRRGGDGDRDHERQRGRGSANDDERRPSPPRGSQPRSRSRSRSPSGPPPEQPNFNQSGLLAAATNTVTHADGTSTVLKYNEPPEARKPSQGWRLYVFKGDEQVDLLHIHRQSAYLFGRDKAVADVAVDHPSCSKQHAAIQFRQVQERDEWGASKPVVKPFIIDLESTNGTHVNGTEIPASRYYELKASDVVKFGLSAREYVLLHDEA
ncbi:hypothetical protein BOTBODRAFT_188124 [Botryobasidium botryosum FD-172 SS1]|uniref:FHA domain-containing protein n=1 Tax=Botryobasidium botryosum (strain FD-172 SS1) TaxID=930990 RepID=A0A067MGV0_BOTB1|nr:hypothetical protein BOTBODRAFT_188124 [Botryobasidium botryosum FD-172 SS1]